MTEAEWDSSTDPHSMLNSLEGKASERQLRLFVAACCRQMWSHLRDGRSREAVEVGEQHADGLGGKFAREAALQRAFSALNSITRPVRKARGTRPIPLALRAAVAARIPVWASLSPAVAGVVVNESLAVLGSEWASSLCCLLRCVFGNPFRPIPFDSAWRTLDVAALARAAYEHRLLPSGHLDPVRLAVLADALLDAGCDNTDLLAHLRGDRLHSRGCWAVDLLLASG